MIKSIAVFIVIATSPVFAKEHPVGYWEKMYNIGESPAASYSMSIEVPDIGKATMEVDRRITKAGGSLVNMNSYDSNGKKIKSLTYSINSKEAEAISKGFFDLGDLQNYSVQRNRGGADGDEIRDKLTDIANEQTANAECLIKMPISAYLLTARVNHLKQALTSIEGGSVKATLQLSLTEPLKDKK